MSDTDLLLFALRSTYVPISPTHDGPVFFGICDALRLMKPHGWNRDRVRAALLNLIESRRVRSCPVQGFGGNVHVYGLTSKP